MKDQKLSSLQRYRDQAIPGRPTKHVRKHVLAIFATYMETRLRLDPSKNKIKTKNFIFKPCYEKVSGQKDDYSICCHGKDTLFFS